MSGQRKKSLRRPLDLDYCLGFSFLSAIQSTVIFLPLLWLCFVSLLLDLFCSQFVLFSGHHVRSGSRTLSDDLYLPRRRAGSGNGRLETCTSGAGANLLTRSARSFECIKLCLCSRVWVCARYVKPVRCRIERLFFFVIRFTAPFFLVYLFAHGSWKEKKRGHAIDAKGPFHHPYASPGVACIYVFWTVAFATSKNFSHDIFLLFSPSFLSALWRLWCDLLDASFPPTLLFKSDQVRFHDKN